MHRPTTLERAYELARSGPCTNVKEIRVMLKREQHDMVDGHLGSPTISRHLRDICKARVEALTPAADE